MSKEARDIIIRPVINENHEPAGGKQVYLLVDKRQ